MLEHGKSNAGGPLCQGAVGVEMQQVSIVRGRRDAEHILEAAALGSAHWKRLYL